MAPVPPTKGFIRRQVSARPPWGPKVAVTGDSKAAGAADQANRAYAQSWPMWLGMLSDAQVYMPYNGGHGGYTSTQLQAVFAAEVLAQNPDVVIEDMGTNDQLDGSNHPAATIAALTAIHQQCLAQGVGFVMTTLTPSGKQANPTPAAPTLTVETTGGSISASSPQYKIAYGNTATVNGISLASPAATATVSSGSTNTVFVAIPFSPDTGIVNVYKSLDGGSTWGRIAQILPSGQTDQRWWFRDTGIAPNFGATLPNANTSAIAQTSADRRKILTINAWKKSYAEAHGVPLIDFYSVGVDPATGTWKQGYSQDGTHPARNAAKLLGQAAWTALAPYMRARTPPGSLDNADPNNLAWDINGSPNGLMSTVNAGNATGPIASGWADFGGTGSGVVLTCTARSGYRGNAQTMQRTVYDVRFNGPASQAQATVTPGHTYVFCIKCEFIGGDLGATGGVSAGWVGASGNLCGVIVNQDLGPLRFQSWPVVAPVGATKVRVQMNLGDQLPGTICAGEVVIYDLTAMGVA